MDKEHSLLIVIINNNNNNNNNNTKVFIVGLAKIIIALHLNFAITFVMLCGSMQCIRVWFDRI